MISVCRNKEAMWCVGGWYKSSVTSQRDDSCSILICSHCRWRQTNCFGFFWVGVGGVTLGTKERCLLLARMFHDATKYCMLAFYVEPRALMKSLMMVLLLKLRWSSIYLWIRQESKQNIWKWKELLSSIKESEAFPEFNLASFIGETMYAMFIQPCHFSFINECKSFSMFEKTSFVEINWYTQGLSVYKNKHNVHLIIF